jgi:hypothetical protein
MIGPRSSSRAWCMSCASVGNARAFGCIVVSTITFVESEGSLRQKNREIGALTSSFANVQTPVMSRCDKSFAK